MRQSLDEILARVRTHYHEVDIKKTNDTAWRDYYVEVVEDERKLKAKAKTVAKRKGGVVRKAARKMAKKKK